jgi:hypothetical protein
MARLRRAIASLICIAAILGLMALLMISGTRNPAYHTELCSDYVRCDIGRQHSTNPDTSKMPTLAPPRLKALSTTENSNSLHVPYPGQTVYVQVKTDRADIEVGWAPGDLLGR